MTLYLTGFNKIICVSSTHPITSLSPCLSLSLLPPPPYLSDCQFELSGADGMIRSGQVEEEDKVKPDQAVDCIWTIRAPPNFKVYYTSMTCLNSLHLNIYI